MKSIAIIDDSYSTKVVASPSDMIHADSCIKTVPLLYFHLNIANIIQSQSLTDAIIDNSFSNVHLTSLIDTIRANSSVKIFCTLDS